MADASKATPDPIEDTAPLKRALERAADGKPDRRLSISMLVAGGAPSQRYRFEFAARGSGAVSSRLACEPSERSGDAEVSVEPSELAELARAVLASGVLDTPARAPRFLPDTLVGILDVTYGSSRVRRYFAADPDQAKVQDAEPPAGVARAADAIYAFGARRMGRESVKP
jgi:hypothetical protein